MATFEEKDKKGHKFYESDEDKELRTTEKIHEAFEDLELTEEEHEQIEEKSRLRLKKEWKLVTIDTTDVSKTLNTFEIAGWTIHPESLIFNNSGTYSILISRSLM